MALEDNELFSEKTQSAFPRFMPRDMRPSKLAAIAGAPTLSVGFPLAFNTSTNEWVPWTNGGADGTGTIRGFLYPDEVVASATEEKLVQIMVSGKLHAADVPLPSGESQGNLDTALKAGLSERGLYVEGLAGAY